jgi:hypothetical protein
MRNDATISAPPINEPAEIWKDAEVRRRWLIMTASGGMAAFHWSHNIFVPDKAVDGWRRHDCDFRSWRTAYHEAGHIVTGWLLQFDISAAVSESNAPGVGGWAMVDTKLIEDIPAKDMDRDLGRIATDLRRICRIVVLTDDACFRDRWALRRAVREIKSEALSLVQANWSVVDHFARELFRRKSMDGPDVRNFLARSTRAACRQIANTAHYGANS